MLFLLLLSRECRWRSASWQEWFTLQERLHLAVLFLAELLDELLCLGRFLDNVMNRPGNLPGNMIEQHQVAHLDRRPWVSKGLQSLGGIGCIFLLHDMACHCQRNHAFEPCEIGLGGESAVACCMPTKQPRFVLCRQAFPHLC